MTVPLHTTQFYGARITGTGPTTLYTVPTGYRAVIKAVNVRNTLSTAHQVGIYIDNAHAIFLVSVPGTSGVVGLFQWNGWVVIDAGQTIAYQAASGSSFDLSVGGYVYPLTL